MVQLLAGSLWRMAAGSCEFVHTSAGIANTLPDNDLNNSVMPLRRDLKWNNHRGQRLEGEQHFGLMAGPWISPSIESRNQTNGDKWKQMHLSNVPKRNERRSLCVTAEKELSSVVTFKWGQTQRNNKAQWQKYVCPWDCMFEVFCAISCSWRIKYRPPCSCDHQNQLLAVR